MWLSFQVLVPLMVGSGLNNGATAACTLIFSKKQSKEEIKRETTTWKSPKKKKKNHVPISPNVLIFFRPIIIKKALHP